jgi:hypothetical protein
MPGILKRIKWIILPAALVCILQATAAPESGDVFREYYQGEMSLVGEPFLRVGPDNPWVPPDWMWNGEYPRELAHDFDLEDAIKVETVVEIIECHAGTDGLQIQINDNDWIPIPRPESVPDAWYQYTHFPAVEIPLEQFQSGTGNTFRMAVTSSEPGYGPQNLIYGLHFRIYYDPEAKPHATGRITSPVNNNSVGISVDITAEVEAGDRQIKRVDYIAFNTDINWEGDGVYRQWHYHFFRGEIMHHVGSAAEAPFEVSWNTEWVPTQEESVKLMARIIDESDLIYMTEEVTGLCLSRTGHSVELSRPYDVPSEWVTRNGKKSEHFDISGNLENIKGARIAWSAWAGGFCNGILINGTNVGCGSVGPDGSHNYDAAIQDVEDLNLFHSGQNVLEAEAHTDGHHGMEINWPGIQVLIQYDADEEECVTPVREPHRLTRDGIGSLPWKVIREGQGTIVALHIIDKGTYWVQLASADGGRISSKRLEGPTEYRLNGVRVPGIYILKIRSRTTDETAKIVIHSRHT